MLDPSGGSGNGGTNWYGKSVPDMWIAMANQQTDNHWTLLSGWRKSYELTLQHMSAVRNYRDNLAAAWPPDKSAASAAYLQRLDDLLANLQQTYDAAVANYSTFSTATVALDSARHELKTVYDEYVANEGKLAAHQRKAADGSATGNGAASSKPPVADGRQAELEARARSVMYGLSGELTAATMQIRKPKPYEPDRHRFENEDDRRIPTYTAPSVPPIVPSDAGISSSAQASQPNSVDAPSVGATPSTPSSGRVPGLVLGGVEAPTTQPPPAQYPPAIIGPSYGATLTPPAVPSLPPTVMPGQTIIPPTSMRGITGDALGRGVPSTGPASPVRALLPGGVIGTVPGIGGGQPSGPSRPTNVNPIGGVINSGSQASGSTAAAGRSDLGRTQPLIGGPGRSSTMDDEREARRWDPGNPWETAEGVAPVVVPAAERPVDPGPAIGLR
jgi:hypothetical protein